MTELFPPESTPSVHPDHRAHGRGHKMTSARYGAFTDAVVAIAMTLLILPLMEVVPEAASSGQSAGELLSDHAGQFFAFALSFVLIAVFWFVHHRIYWADTPHDGRLAVANLAWMATIVFLPVVTAMSGSDIPTDRIMIALYVGTLAISSWLLLLLAHFQLAARRRAHMMTAERTILAPPLAMSVLFTVALGLAEAFPEVNYFFLFLMFGTGPLRRLVIKVGMKKPGPAPKRHTRAEGVSARGRRR